MLSTIAIYIYKYIYRKEGFTHLHFKRRLCLGKDKRLIQIQGCRGAIMPVCVSRYNVMRLCMVHIYFDTYCANCIQIKYVCIARMSPDRLCNNTLLLTAM